MTSTDDQMTKILDDVEMYQISSFDLIRHKNSFQEHDTQSILKYLSSKENLPDHDPEEELIFYPQLYGMCHRHQTECNCLTEVNPDVMKNIENYIRRTITPNKSHPILNFLHEYNFVEIYLDDLKLNDRIPEKIFSCRNLKLLSLKGNNLEKLSAGVGSLRKLETLYLSNNNLTDDSIPHTLTFCQQLRTLYLDNNRILRLPGFLLKMRYLWMLKRDGINVTSCITMHVIKQLHSIEKITPVEEVNKKSHLGHISTLQKLASHVLIANKVNPFLIEESIRNTMFQYYWECPICENCSTTKFQDCGYFVNTYLYGYLGDYLSLFVNKTCSKKCADQLLSTSLKDDRLTMLKQLSSKMIRPCDMTTRIQMDEKYRRRENLLFLNCCIVM